MPGVFLRRDLDGGLENALPVSFLSFLSFFLFPFFLFFFSLGVKPGSVLVPGSLCAVECREITERLERLIV